MRFLLTTLLIGIVALTACTPTGDDGWDANAQCVLQTMEMEKTLVAVHRACIKYCERYNAYNADPRDNPCWNECSPQGEPLDPELRAAILGTKN